MAEEGVMSGMTMKGTIPGEIEEEEEEGEGGLDPQRDEEVRVVMCGEKKTHGSVVIEKAAELQVPRSMSNSSQ